MNKECINLFDYCKSHTMKDIESIEDFYQRKFNWMPDQIRKEIGHFNLFRLEPYVEGKST